MTADRWGAFFAKLRRTPPLLIVQKTLRRVPFRPVDVGKLCFLRLEGVPKVPPSLLRGSGFVRRGTLDDLDALVQLRDQRAVFEERFAAGDHCVVVLVDDHIVGFEWFCDRDVHREGAWGYRIDIPGGFVYAYVGELMIASGERGVLTFVDYGNLPSLRTHLRFGFKPAATVLAMKVLGWLMTLNIEGL
jgi:hypothetical protein